MNKQEAIEKIEKLDGLTIKDKGFNFDIKMIPKGDVLEIIEQIDEPEKPVVPQFVADWIEWCKRNKVFLLGGFSAIDELGFAICNDKKVKSLKASKWATRNQETFAQAWLFGYETKKDKLYQVELPGSHKEGDIILVKDDNGDITYDVVFSDRWKERDYTKLTEDEIKRDHSWAWQFAKEVKND